MKMRKLSSFLASVSAILLGVTNLSAQNLFMANGIYNNIVEITPSGGVSTYASGLQDPWAVAFDKAGNLFVGNEGAGTITKITTGGGIKISV